MAILQSSISGKKIVLKSYHVIGRSKATVHTFLQDKDVSQIHASIRWNGQQWEITSHGRNGIWLNNQHVLTGTIKSLHKGDRIRFGAGVDCLWKIINIDPPAASLVPLRDDEPVLELSRFQIIPDENQPMFSIFISDTGRWICEDENGTKFLHDGDTLLIGNKIYQFHDAGPIDTTIEGPNCGYFPLEEIEFHFSVSLDEEHVFLKIMHNTETILDLGERVHHYLLLTLARQRLEDSKNGDDPSSQGWLEPAHLAEMLNIDTEHLNIQVYRARKQLSTALPVTLHLSRVIERRVNGMRFGYSNFQIVRGSDIEGRMFQGDVLITTD